MSDCSYNAEDYIEVNTDILNCKWRKYPNTMVVYLHCLMSANTKDVNITGKVTKRGHFETTYKELSNILGITEKGVKTAFKRLEMTGELTVITRDNYIEITVNNYGKLVRLKQIEEREKTNENEN